MFNKREPLTKEKLVEVISQIENYQPTYISMEELRRNFDKKHKISSDLLNKPTKKPKDKN